MQVKFQTSAGGIVYKKEGDQLLWLIIQHSEHKGWSFPKGLVGDQENESKETAALREVEEEGGVKIKIVDPDPVISYYSFVRDGIRIKKTVYYFLMEYLSGDPKDHDWEVSEAKFLDADEVRKTLSFKRDKEVFEKILLKLKS